MTALENRNLVLAILIVVLSAVTGIYYLYTQREESPVDQNTFRAPDLLAIDEVMLESQEATVNIAFDGVRWNVNGELADRTMIDVLFATLEQVKPLRPVARLLQDSISEYLQRNGVRVSLLSEATPIVEFVAGGNARKTQAWFYKPGDRAYVMAIPGYRVYASGIFEMDRLGWKDKHAFQINWRNFNGLKATFPNDASSDFEVKFVKDYFSIEGMSSADTTRLNDFLDALSFLTVTEYSNDVSALESLRAAMPEMVITLSDVTRKAHTLALYPARSASERIAGIIDDRYLAFFDPKAAGDVLKKRAHFASIPK